MRFRMFSSQPSPIAIDFGAASVKLLQIAPGEKPAVIAAAEVPVPDRVRDDAVQRMAHLEGQLSTVLKSGGFKGRRVVCAVPVAQTVLQHLQLVVPEGVRLFEAAKSQIHMSMNAPYNSLVVRAHEVAQVNRDGSGGGARTEVICLAIPRDLIMKHIALLEKFRLEVVGVHAQPTAIVRAFDHIHRRAGDAELTTMYVDLGYSCSTVTIAHGAQMIFARAIQVGGLHFDQLIAKALRCDLAGARAHRLSLVDPIADQAAAGQRSTAAQEAGEADMGGLAQLRAAMKREQDADGSGADDVARAAHAVAGLEERRKGHAAPVIAQSVEPGQGHTSAANVDFTEVLETITDEMSMCLRYHRGLFPNRNIDRVVLLGGEARQTWLCRHVAKALRLPARLGDPLARFATGEASGPFAPDRSQPQPGWSTACGLCADSGDTSKGMT